MLLRSVCFQFRLFILLLVGISLNLFIVNRHVFLNMALCISRVRCGLMGARADLGNRFVKAYRQAALPDGHKELLEDLISRVRDIAQQCVNKPEVECFGSFVTGFCKPTSDVDMSLTYRNHNWLLLGHPKVDEQASKKLSKFSKSAAAMGMDSVRYVEARIPVVSFVDGITSLNCDVSIGNVGGVENSKMLRMMHHVHRDLIGCFVHSVKEWGKAREVIAPDRGTFNSFTVTTMALMVLQELGILPVFSNPSGKYGELTVKDVETALVGWKLPPAYDRVVSDDDLAEANLFLLSSFGQYYSALDYKIATVSLICPRRLRSGYQQSASSYLDKLSKDKKKVWEEFNNELKLGPVDDYDFCEAMRAEQVQRPHTSPFVVEDIANMVNCGRRAAADPCSHSTQGVC